MSADLDLKRALDALDAREVPAADPAWESGVLLAIKRERRVRRTRLLTRVAMVACMVFATGAAFALAGRLAPGDAGTAPVVAGGDRIPHAGGSPAPSPSATQVARDKPDAKPSPQASPDERQSQPGGEGPDAGSAGSAPDDGAVAMGDGWATRPPQIKSDLSDVVFVDRRHGWVAGGAAILATTDGGRSWRAVRPGGGTEWRAVSFADTERGWAVAGDGSVATTTDGGATWSTGTLDAADGLRDVAAAGKGALAVGEGGLIVATPDGDAWERRSSGTTADLNAVVFADEPHGWAVGDEGAVVTTTDGGATWEARTVGKQTRLVSVSFAGARRGWAAGVRGPGDRARAVLLATTDGGATWSTRFLGEKGSVFRGVAFIDRRRGWALGASASGRPQCLFTTDGGRHWRLSADLGGRPTAIACAPSGAVWIVGDDGRIYGRPRATR